MNRTLRQALLALCTAITLLGLSTHLYLFTPSLYTHLHESQGSADGSETFSRQVISFLRDGTDLPASLNAAETAHMHDVRTFIQSFFFIYTLCLLALLWTAQRDGWAALARPALYGTIGLVTIGLLTIVLPFDTAFTLFHEAFFTPGTWQFPATSPLIQAYPQAFFAAFSRLIGLTAAALCALTALVAGKTLLNHNNP